MVRPLSNVVGFDDAPFSRAHRGNVTFVGAVFARSRLDGVIVDHVRRDGADATRRILSALRRSQFAEHVQAIVLQGIAMAGFNVVDVVTLQREAAVPVLVVARRKPDLVAMRAALARVRGGARKWALVERAGPMEPIDNVWVQRVGIDTARARRFLREHTIHGSLPEPVRVAHLIAGAIVTGVSRGGA